MARARAAGLLTPHASREMGGLALSHVAKAIVFEEAGYSPLGPVALNIHAPDEGNIHLMDVVATEAQKDRWLRPLVQGHARSCFAMTEPAPGSGSDPSMLRTTATRDGDDYLINGRKWLITGAEGADFGIVMARMEDGTATMFLTDMKRDGIIHERQLDSLEGHAEIRENSFIWNVSHCSERLSIRQALACNSWSIFSVWFRKGVTHGIPRTYRLPCIVALLFEGRASA